MSFSTILLIALVAMLIYYGVMIFMDINADKSAEDRDKPSVETDVDISDEAAEFQPTSISLDDQKKKKSPTRNDVRMTGGQTAEAFREKLDRFAYGTDLHALDDVICICNRA